MQGDINEKLQPQPPPGQGPPSSFQKRQEAADEEEDTSSSSPDQLYKRPPLNWLANLPRPELGDVPYGELITTCYEPGTVALTFDDGPWQYTEDLLNILRDYDAQATFFVCGGNMGGDGQITENGHPHLLRRMVEEGHQVGTHTWAHADLTTVDEYGILDQLLFNEQAIVQALDRIPTYFRPPYFSTNEDVLDTVGDFGYHVINAGVDTNDWKGDYDAARQAFSQAVQGGSADGSGGRIVLAHDIHERTVHELAAYMIEEARNAGFRLVTVGECMGDAEENWYRDPRTGGSWSASPQTSLVKRGEVPPPPPAAQDKEFAEKLRRYSRFNYTEDVGPFDNRIISPGLLPYLANTEKPNKLVARASESVSESVSESESESEPRMVPYAFTHTGDSSPSPKATFGLFLALVSVFFMLQ